MVPDLLFSPSVLFHLERTCNYIQPCSTFHWYQTQLHHSSIHMWLLVEFRWGRRGFSYFGPKVGWCPPYLWVFKFVILFFFNIFWHDFDKHRSISSSLFIDVVLHLIYLVERQPGKAEINFLFFLVDDVWHFYHSSLGCLFFYLLLPLLYSPIRQIFGHNSLQILN